MDEMEKKIMQPYACRVTADVRNQLNELMDGGKFSTQNQLVETLIEAYLNPKKEKSKVKELEAINAEITAKYEKLLSDYDGLKILSNNYVEKINVLVQELEAAKSKIPDVNTMVIPVTEFHRKVLQSLCKRENEKRKRTDLTPEIFVMFVIEEMLVNSNVFTIDVLSSSELKRIRNELNETEK